MASRRIHPADAIEAERIAQAAHFVVCRITGRIPGQAKPYTTEQHPTVEAAREAAAGHPRTIIYAVSAEGFSFPLSRPQPQQQKDQARG